MTVLDMKPLDHEMPRLIKMFFLKPLNRRQPLGSSPVASRVTSAILGPGQLWERGAERGREGQSQVRVGKEGNAHFDNIFYLSDGSVPLLNK